MELKLKALVHQFEKVLIPDLQTGLSIGLIIKFIFKKRPTSLKSLVPSKNQCSTGLSRGGRPPLQAILTTAYIQSTGKVTNQSHRVKLVMTKGFWAIARAFNTVYIYSIKSVSTLQGSTRNHGIIRHFPTFNAVSTSCNSSLCGTPLYQSLFVSAWRLVSRRARSTSR